jgi:hypothetical protein
VHEDLVGRRAEANKAVFDVIEATRRSKDFVATQSLLDDAKRDIVPMIKGYEMELSGLSLTNMVLWSHFKTAFESAGPAYKDSIPNAHKCNALTDYKIRDW